MRSAVTLCLLLCACSSTPDHVDAGSCLSDRDCPTAHPLCDRTHLQCVDCLSNADCAVDESCIASACVVTTSCTSSAECTTGVCDIAASSCVECLAETDCAAHELCEAEACVAEGACAPPQELAITSTGCVTLDVPATGPATCGGMSGTVVRVRRTTTQPWALSLCAQASNLCVGTATVDADRCTCGAGSTCTPSTGAGTQCTGWPLSSLSTAEHLVVGATSAGMIHLTLCSPPDHTMMGM